MPPRSREIRSAPRAIEGFSTCTFGLERREKPWIYSPLVVVMVARCSSLIEEVVGVLLSKGVGMVVLLDHLGRVHVLCGRGRLAPE